MKIGVVIFPGSNCDHDTLHAFGDVLGEDVYQIWHKDTSVGNPDLIVIPGGFSYGDYLRCGAIARFSPVMEAVIKHARRGGLILGICNGFQVLCEAGLLPGTLLMNEKLAFLGRDIHIRVENRESPYTCAAEEEQVLRLPVAHGEGNYFADSETLDMLEGEGRVLFSYVGEHGEITVEDNLNGSSRSIAGICSENRRVAGLMPHPERACEPELEGKSDGLVILSSIVNWSMETV